MRQWILGIALVVVTLGGVVAAQADYKAGQRAWDAGLHSEALREWQAAANSGDAKAMLALGRLYVQGLGAPQNYVQAHMWFSLAASRFDAEAVKERDALAVRMSPEQVAEAQKLAAAWQPGESQPAAATTKKPAGPPPPKAIREAQELLATLGYEPDPPDGQWGARTAQAYQAFVRDANLPKTDTLTPAALKAMRAKARQAGSVSTPKPKPALQPDALHRAAKIGNLKGLEAALAAGADVNARDDKGWTALMYVVDKGYVLLVEPLVKAKADPDLRAPDGATALFMAVAHGHGEIIPMLMEAGADPTIKGPKNKTAVDLALLNFEKRNKKAWVSTLLNVRDCEQCPEMVVVPAGRFRMGDLSGGGRSDERPVHQVTIDYPFAVGKYEVTFAEWDACVAAGGCTHRPDDEGDGRGTRPVLNVSWNDAQEYLTWLSRETGQSYRLLSEAEWEYVARARTTTKYWWGNKADHAHANYGKDECCEGEVAGADRWKYTAPVGSFEPNAFGLFDTAGNVWEWVADCRNDSYAGAPADGSAWTSGNCDMRVVRGGSWGFDPRHLRIAGRNWSDPGDRYAETGFRVARTLTPTLGTQKKERVGALREGPPGSTFRDCEQCPEMVVVRAGRFRMGDGADDRRPVHDVTIDDPFAVGKYEVTFAEWDACVVAGGCTYRPNGIWGRGTQPVVYISWDDAQEYVAWLSRKMGKPYRLLSEAEWEYVARAGTTTKYSWGKEIGTNKANCEDCGSRWDDKSTAPVGSFEANAFGLFDTAGNVWEWVEDCWHYGYAGAPSDESAWTSGDCSERVLRGGSWSLFPWFLRTAQRYGNDAGGGYGSGGFRVARTLD